MLKMVILQLCLVGSLRLSRLAKIVICVRSKLSEDEEGLINLEKLDFAEIIISDEV